MNEQTLTEVIRLKLKIMETIMNDLPDEIRSPLKQAEKTFLKAVHEATGACLADNTNEVKPANAIKPIPID